MPSRRDVLATIGAGATAGLAGCAGGDCTPNDPAGIDWPQPGGDPRNTAAAPDYSVPSRVGERWRTPIVPDNDLRAFAGGVVDSGQVVAAGRTREGGFCNRFSLRGGDAEQGRSIPMAIAAPPVSISGGIALVYMTDGGAELSVLDGEGRGHSFAGSTPPAPRADDGVLFCGDTGGAFVYDVADDDRRWHHAFGDEQEGGAVPFSPVVDDESVYVAVTSSSDRGIYALDRLDGEIEWEVTGPRASRGLVRVGSLLIVPVRHELLAFDAATGERRWSTPTPADRRTFLSPAGTEDGLVVSDGAALHRLDPETGELGWSVDAAGAGRPLVVGDAVLSSTESGVVARELGDGSERWRIDDVSLVAPLRNGVVVRREDELIACTACEN